MRSMGTLLAIALGLVGRAEGQGEVCYRQALPSRKLANRYIRLSKTAYSLQDCQDLCSRETSFGCLGFSYRQPQQAGEVLNCDLTDKDTSSLDPYSSYDFYQESSTDFYERSGSGPDCSADPQASGRECSPRHLEGHKHYTYRDYRTAATRAVCALECRVLVWCSSFSFRTSSASSDIGNCLLSDTATSALRDPEDIVQDPSWNLHGLSLSPSCSSAPGTALPSTQECKVRTDYRLGDSVVGERGAEDSRQLCARRCGQRASCNSFSYRETGRDPDGHNCYLSPREVTGLAPRDTEYSPGWAVYSTAGDCGGPGAGPGQAGPCHRRERIGYTIAPRQVSAARRAASATECSEQCGQEGCKAFAYRFSSSPAAADNCLLSRSGPGALAGQGLLQEDAWDLYSRLESCRSSDNECAEESRSGQRHRTGVESSARSLEDCARRCGGRASCRSFSYSARGSSRSCLLSPLGTAELQTWDLTRDRDWAVYRPLSCSGGGGGGSSYYPTRPNTRPEQEACYTVLSASHLLTGAAARRALPARDLRACQQECGREPQFRCRALSFTSGPGYAPNCLLSDTPATELLSGRELVRDYSSDVYERRGGTRCREDGAGGQYGPGFQEQQEHTRCSNFESPGERLSRGAGRAEVRARDAAACEARCLEARFPCRTFAFRYGGGGGGAEANCELSEVDSRELVPGRDTHRERDWDLYSRTRYSGQCRGAEQLTPGSSYARLGCYSRYRSDTTFRARAVVETVQVSDNEECARLCDFFRDRRQYQCYAFAFRRERTGGSCALSDSYGRDLDSDLEPGRDWQLWQHEGEGPRCRAGPGVAVAGEYTVSGARCLRGGCRLNPDVNYWYCETEDEQGWDYCCRPDARCGYSEGFSYPWCFVGEAGYDQWRPCDAERARMGDRASGFLASGRPRYSFRHPSDQRSLTAPARSMPPSKVTYTSARQPSYPSARQPSYPSAPQPSYPSVRQPRARQARFNSADLPFTSLDAWAREQNSTVEVQDLA